jgi:hypothetical protein
MKLPTKAALFSALIVPGAGHWLLRKYPFAITYSVFSLIALLYIAGFAVSETQTIVEEIVRGKIQVDTGIISTFIERIYIERPFKVKVASYGLALTWFLSIVHAYISGQKQLHTQKKGSSNASRQI